MNLVQYHCKFTVIPLLLFVSLSLFSTGPALGQNGIDQSKLELAERVMDWGKQRMIYRTLDNMHRRVEATRVWDSADSALSNVPGSPKFDDENAFYILKSALQKQAHRYNKLEQSLSKISKPLSPLHIRLLHRYELLPTTFLNPRETVQYLQSSRSQRIQFLDKRTHNSVFRSYLLGRLYWQTGQYEQALELFQEIKTRIQIGTIPWVESELYRVSSLFKLKNYEEAEAFLSNVIERYKKHLDEIDESQQRFVEVEGIWSVGTPLMKYLETWLEAIRSKNDTSWYETIGQAHTDVLYYRFFNTHYPNEPLGQLIAGQIQKATGADFAVFNHKGMRGGIKQGPIKRHELLLILPFNNETQTAVIEKPSKATSDTMAKELNKSLESLLQGTFFRAKFSLGTGDPLSFSSGITVGKEGFMECPQFPFGIDDTVTMSTGRYVMGRIVNRSLGVLIKSSLSVFPTTDREIFKDYLRREDSIDTAVLGNIKKGLPEASFMGMEPTQFSGLSMFSTVQIIARVQHLIMLILGVGLFVGLFRNWRDVTPYFQWGIYFALGTAVIYLTLTPAILDGIQVEMDGIFQVFMYIFLAVGLVFSSIKIFLFTTMGFHYSTNLKLPSFPFLREETEIQDLWQRALAWSFGLTGLAVIFSVGLFYFTNPKIPETVQNLKKMGIFDVHKFNKPSVLVAINFLVVAFVEEIVYRFGIQNFLASFLKLGKEKYWVAIWITAGLWSIGHVASLEPAWVKIVQILPFGVALGYLYQRYGVEMCVLCHGFFNVVMVFVGPYVINMA